MRLAVTELDQHSSLDAFLAARFTGGDLQDNLGTLPHPAASMLSQLRSNGAVARLSTPAWGDERKTAIATRGAHPSSADALDFLREEFYDYVTKGFWTVFINHFL